MKVPAKSHRVWATCASTSKKKEKRKYWQMSINSALIVWMNSSALGICKCTNDEFQFKTAKYTADWKEKNDFFYPKGYFPKRYCTKQIAQSVNCPWNWTKLHSRKKVSLKVKCFNDGYSPYVSFVFLFNFLLRKYYPRWFFRTSVWQPKTSLIKLKCEGRIRTEFTWTAPVNLP